MPWLGRKKIAFVPVHRPSFDTPMPADWIEQIQHRVFIDLDGGGVDISLRAYFSATSYGRADFDATILAPVIKDQGLSPVDGLEQELGSQLRAAGFDCACLVMRGGIGAGTGQAGGFWALN